MRPDSPPDPRFASSLAHGIAVIEAFERGRAALTNKQLAARTGLSKATVSRLTYTLAARGLVVFDAATRCYRLGPATLALGYPLLVSLRVRGLARLPMKQLSDELNASVSLGMRERTRMVYVETSRGNDPVAFLPDVGAALPMLQTAMGRAWLASAPQAERRRILAAIRAEDPAQHRRWAAALDEAGSDLRRCGFCLSRGDWQPDVHAVARPLDIELGGERLVLNCGVAARRLRRGELESRIGPRLLDLARRIEDEWRAESAAAPATPIAPIARLPRWAPEVRVSSDPDDRQFVRTLARGMDLLLCFQPGDDALGNREFARRLGVSPQTVVRLAHTLRELGYLRRDTQAARDRLGAAALAAAYPMLSDLRLRNLARPAMLALSQRTGGAVSLGLHHQTGMIYVETAWRADGRLLPPDTGAPMPMLATAMGRAWLCGATPAERETVLNQIRVFDPAGFARFDGVVERALAQFERHGHCSSRDFRPEIEAFAVPFAAPVDSVRFVMNCGVLAPTPLPARRARTVAAALTEVVREVETALA